MKYFLIRMMLIMTLSISAQEITSDSIYNASDVDKKPEYIGGNNNFYKFIATNYRSPEKSNFNGKVLIEFVVEKDGSLSTFKIVQDPGYGTGEEAIRVFTLSPAWTPGEKNGKIVRTAYRFPILIRNED